ncbi:WhiB family transcriptional regulator [Mycobacterium scrofulaceum]|uniref:4Fe-4S Wbl-type domain-containing protein n=1 Tax=Mycobacterium scrofulaceum TaxID=1783 RepID=A0A1A2W0I9_MYCSC|nr:WhiB family transcriptional regulator [Mycobacterium scrofulaceum]OBI07074.1 hypothetical protein A5679_11570 [Mycobacterium scrofulaceum]
MSPPIAQCDVAYSIEVAHRALVVFVLGVAPHLPRAACKGRAPLFDGVGVHRQHTGSEPVAFRICQGCPERARCAAWAASQAHPRGVLAGQLYRSDRQAPKRRATRPRRKPIPHGSDAGYAAGCRCDRCREAHTDAHRAWRARSQIPAAST